MNDHAIRITAGTIGTATSLVLADVEAAAAIFAGLATGCYMLAATVNLIRKKKKP